MPQDMADTPDPSSTAAHSAQVNPPLSPNSRPSFWGRLIGRVPPIGRQGDSSPDLPETLLPRPGLMNLRHMRVQDVSVPSAEIIAVPADISKEALVALFHESGKTRLPVYQTTLDSPLGFVHLKDFALRHGFDKNEARFDIAALLRPLLYVPPSMTIGVLLTKMQTERIHMALVIDEYGGTDGLVTIEDLIEQVIGEIADEHDIDEAQLWSEETPGCYVAAARTPLEDFEAAIGMSLTDHDEIDEEDIETLGGLVFMLTGSIPARGQMVSHPGGIEFEVVDADPRRIKRLRVHVPQTLSD